MSKFQSTAFYLAQWANKEQEKPEIVAKSPVLLDIVENEDTRQVCKGDNCALYYNRESKDYENIGSCKRNTLCTETRILRDAYYIKTGSNSTALNCINHPKQLKSWLN